VQALPSVQLDPTAAKASAGQVVALPVQLSATSQSPEAARQTVDDGRKCAVQVALAPTVPEQVSCASQSPLGAPPHAVPGVCAASAGQSAAPPLHASSTSHSPAEARQVVPAETNPFAGQAAAMPVQASATSQSPATARHVVPELTKPSAGHVVALPVHSSATSHSPAIGRQVVDDGRKRAVQVAFAPTVPEQVSCASQSPFGGPPHALPGACAASAGQAAPLPVHASVTSHSPAEARQVVPAETKRLAGQMAALPVQLSATSQMPPLVRHTVEEGAKLATQVAFAPTVPEQVSWASQSPLGGPPHALPGACAASAGQAALLPLHASVTSHSPAEARQVVPAETKSSVGQVVVLPVQLSATSQAPPLERHTVEEGANFATQVAVAPTEPEHVS
jgi:hypothetical protein